MEGPDLIHRPGQHPLLPPPKELNIRPARANALAAEVLKQMMEDAPVIGDQVLDISARVPAISEEVSSSKPPQAAGSPSWTAPDPNRSAPQPGGEKNAEGEDSSSPSQPNVSPKLAETSSPEQDDEEDVLSNGCDLPIPKQGEGYVPKIDLSPGLSPLSSQHPTRVWNSLLHACLPEHQPSVKWTFNQRPDGYVAEMTLTLPPEHPLLRGQLYDPTTSFNDLATHKINGAERRWTGQARRLKAEAQNAVIRNCIVDNGLLWANYHVMRSVDPQTYLGSAYTGEMSLMCVTPVVASMQVRKRLSEGEDSSGRRVKSRPSGTSTPPTPQDDTEAFATEGNRDGSRQTQFSTSDRHTATYPSQMQVGHKGHVTQRQVDWQQELLAFCLEAGLPAPQYNQRIKRQQRAPTLFFGMVKVEDDCFESDKGFVKLKDARQEVARFVFCEHFGQEPAPQ